MATNSPPAHNTRSQSRLTHVDDTTEPALESGTESPVHESDQEVQVNIQPLDLSDNIGIDTTGGARPKTINVAHGLHEGDANTQAESPKSGIVVHDKRPLPKGFDGIPFDRLDVGARAPHSSPNRNDRTDTAEIKVVEQLTAALSKLAAKPQPITENTKGLNFAAPKFEGTDREFFTSWRREYEDFSICMGWTDDVKLRGLSMVLSGRAKQLFQDIPIHLKQTWQSAISELEQKHETSTFSMNKFTLLERVQGQGESVSDYTIDMVHRLRVAGVSDEAHKLSHYYKGLLPSIKRAVFVLQPKSLEECEKQAKLVEENIRMNGEIGLTPTDGDITTLHPDSDKPADRTAKTVSFRTDSPARFRSQRDDRASRPRYKTNGKQHVNQANARGNRFPDRSGQYRRRTPTPSASHRANAQQHHRTDANRPSQAPQKPAYQRFCTQCNERHPWGEHTNPTCARCGTSGHTRMNCQNF